MMMMMMMTTLRMFGSLFWLDCHTFLGCVLPRTRNVSLNAFSKSPGGVCASSFSTVNWRSSSCPSRSRARNVGISMDGDSASQKLRMELPIKRLDDDAGPKALGLAWNKFSYKMAGQWGMNTSVHSATCRFPCSSCANTCMLCCCFKNAVSRGVQAGS